MTAAYEDGPYRLQDSHAQRAFVSWQYVAPLIYARQVMITLGIETVLLEKSQHGFCMGIIISSALLHKVRHLQFWHAICGYDIWRICTCTIYSPAFSSEKAAYLRVHFYIGDF